MAVPNRALIAYLPALRAGLAACILWLAACASEPTTDSSSPPPEPGDTTEYADRSAATREFPVDTLYELLVAEMASNRGQYPMALENYQRQAYKTRDPQIAAQAARLANAVGTPEQTAELARLWLELEPDKVDAHYLLATSLSRQGRVREAFAQMQQVERLAGQAPYSRIAADSLNQPEKARTGLLEDIQRVLSDQPDNVELLMAKSIIQQASDEEAALASARRARSLAPDNAQTVILEASLLKQMSRPEEALNLLQESVSQAPDNIRIRRFYARSLFAVDPQGAAEQFQVLQKMAPNDSDTMFFLALTLTRLQRYDEASAQFNQLLEQGVRTDEANYHLGLIALEQKQTRQALEYFRRVGPGQEYLSATSQIARILLAADQRDALQRHFAAQRSEHDMLSVSLFVLEADIIAQLGDYTTSIALLNQALAEHDNDTRLLYARALTAEKKQDIAAAERDLRRILAQEPDNAMALNALGYMLTNHSERHAEAYKLIEQALQQKPEDPTVLDSMGWVNYRLGKLDQALYYLENAYQRYPDAEIAAHLGEVLWQSGQRNRALEIWREALAREPEHEVLLETLHRYKIEQP